MLATPGVMLWRSSQAVLQGRQVALPDGGEEPRGQLFSLPPGGVVARSPLAYVVAGPRDQVPCVVHIGADDLGDLRVRILEHLT
jgi:hypothetical protein